MISKEHLNLLRASAFWQQDTLVQEFKIAYLDDTFYRGAYTLSGTMKPGDDVLIATSDVVNIKSFYLLTTPTSVKKVFVAEKYYSFFYPDERRWLPIVLSSPDFNQLEVFEVETIHFIVCLKPSQLFLNSLGKPYDALIVHGPPDLWFYNQ